MSQETIVATLPTGIDYNMCACSYRQNDLYCDRSDQRLVFKPLILELKSSQRLEISDWQAKPLSFAPGRF